jgi:hypothetical protein
VFVVLLPPRSVRFRLLYPGLSYTRPGGPTTRTPGASLRHAVLLWSFIANLHSHSTHRTLRRRLSPIGRWRSISRHIRLLVEYLPTTRVQCRELLFVTQKAGDKFMPTEGACWSSTRMPFRAGGCEHNPTALPFAYERGAHSRSPERVKKRICKMSRYLLPTWCLCVSVCYAQDAALVSPRFTQTQILMLPPPPCS